MKRLLAIALSILLFATLVAAPLSHGVTINAADRHVGGDWGGHMGLHGPEETTRHGGTVACQIYCAATVEFSVLRDHPLRLRWRWDGFVTARGIAPPGTVPEVDERPPRAVFV